MSGYLDDAYRLLGPAWLVLSVAWVLVQAAIVVEALLDLRAAREANGTRRGSIRTLVGRNTRRSELLVLMLALLMVGAASAAWGAPEPVVLDGWVMARRLCLVAIPVGAVIAGLLRLHGRAAVRRAFRAVVE